MEGHIPSPTGRRVQKGRQGRIGGTQGEKDIQDHRKTIQLQASTAKIGFRV